MIKSLGKLTLATVLAALVAGVPLTVSAQTNTTSTNSSMAPKPHAIPFRGKVASVDAAAKTITLSDKNKRTFSLTAETKIINSGKPATLADLTVGTEVSGSYLKSADGKLVAKSVYFGAKKPGAPMTPAAK